MYDITAFGELLIDFTESGLSPAGNRLFEQNPGGAVGNVVCAAARFGKKTAFIGKVGDDMHGRFLKETLDDVGVSTKGLVITPDEFTTLAFVALAPSGERTFSFARKPGADTCFKKEELDRDILENTRIFHIGSLSLTSEPAREATYEAIKMAKAAGALISYDPNYRASLWDSAETAKKYMRSIVPYADVMKLSDEEMALLTDTDDPEKAMDAIQAQGVKVVAITLGKKGAMVRAGSKTAVAPTYKEAKVVDTTGAGDAFWGGFLTCLVSSRKAIGEMTIEDVLPFAKVGNAVATCCVQKKGAIPAMPTPDQVDAVLKGDADLKALNLM